MAVALITVRPGPPGSNRVDSVLHLEAVGRALRFGTKILPIGHHVCAVGRGLVTTHSRVWVPRY